MTERTLRIGTWYAACVAVALPWWTLLIDRVWLPLVAAVPIAMLVLAALVTRPERRHIEYGAAASIVAALVLLLAIATWVERLHLAAAPAG